VTCVSLRWAEITSIDVTVDIATENDLITTGGRGLEVQSTLLADGQACVLRLRGDVDVYSAPILRSSVQRELDAGCRYVILDAAGSDYFDSTGLGALIASLKAATECTARLEFLSYSAQLARILKVTGLIKAFPLMAPEQRRRLDL
jgi:anti-sigma B factor antagonist